MDEHVTITASKYNKRDPFIHTVVHLKLGKQQIIYIQ